MPLRFRRGCFTTSRAVDVSIGQYVHEIVQFVVLARIGGLLGDRGRKSIRSRDYR